VHDRPLLEFVNGDVFYEDVVNERGFHSLEGYRLVVPIFNMDVLDVDIADFRREVAAPVAVIVVSQPENPGFTNIEVLDIDIFNESAPVQVRLTVQHVAAVIFAVVEKDVADTTGNLAADSYTAEVRRHVAYNDIFARPAFAPRAIVPAGFDRQAVVALVQPAIFHQHMESGSRPSLFEL